jgi:WD40 repeat protein
MAGSLTPRWHSTRTELGWPPETDLARQYKSGDVTNGQQQLEVTHGGWVMAVAFSSDGTWLATGGSDKTARTWNLDRP